MTTKKKSKFSCPSCGRFTVYRVSRDVHTKVGKEEIVIKRVSIEECSHCGERLYDMAAMRQIRTAREEHKRTEAA